MSRSSMLSLVAVSAVLAGFTLAATGPLGTAATPAVKDTRLAQLYVRIVGTAG